MQFIKRALTAVIHFIWAMRNVWYILALIPAYFVLKQGIWFSAVVWAIVSVPVWIVATIYESYIAESPLSSKRRRGREVIDLLTAQKNAAQYREATDEGILWGGVRLPSEDAKNHFCIVGATGSGKSLTIKLLMKDQLPKIMAGTNARALIYDSKQDQLPVLAGLGLQTEVVILNPFDKRCHAWNMAADITTLAHAAELAKILVPTSDNESNPFFTNAVRSLLTGIVTVFMLKYPGKWTFRQVLLVMQDERRLEKALRSNPRTEQLANQFLDPELGITLKNIVTSIGTRLAPYEPIAAAWDKAIRENPENTISIRDWIAGNQILVLGNDETSRSTIDLINQVFVKFASEQSLAASESVGSRSRVTWFFFDEFSEAGKLPGLREIIQRGRSKGCCVVLGFQDIEALYKEYGEHEANAIVGQCGQKALLRMESPPTADWAMEVVSHAEYEETSYSYSQSNQGGSQTFSQGVVQRAEVLKAEFLSMSPPNSVNGLHGVYLAKNIGVYKHRYDFNELIKSLPLENQSVPAYLPRDAADHYIELWNPADDILFDTDEEQTLQQRTTTATRKNEQSRQGLDAINRIKLDS